MLYNDLLARLHRLDEDASLMSDTNTRYRVIIVGGSALILMGRLSRATHDLDAVSVPFQLYSLLAKYDMNTNAEAYINNFPYNFEDRLQPLFSGECIDYYTPSLEDMVIAKLCSVRDTDRADIDSASIREHLNWKQLDYLAHSPDEAKASALNDDRYAEFLIRYNDYKDRWKPCES